VSVERVCLVILDGWGLAEPGPGNAVEQADTPVFDDLWERYPHTTLTAWGPAVGLPEGQMGNSEVGHLNLGAGAVVRQDLLRIDEAIEDGSFLDNDVLKAACDAERVHLLGLVSAGGVHASMDHLKALIELAGRVEVPDVVIHAFTDGRDTNPDSGAGYIAEVEGWGGARIATVSGRYYAMDRDRRWDRTKLAYKGEERKLVDSPRDVPTYDKKPEMSAIAATDAFVETWEGGDFGFGIINFANPDMVGHTGVIAAAVEAIETVDECLGRVVEAVQDSGGVCLVTADHGNADHMLEPDGGPNTAHSMNPVPFIVTADGEGLREGGTLADVAPTVVALLGLSQPEAMTGTSLTQQT
jgi:bisphosphoglycerate-independent phosphoglycerate mutase (AlkP superfamily)